MSDVFFGPMRIWNSAPSEPARSTDRPGPAGAPFAASTSLIDQLALQEVLRPALRLRESFEPLTLAWYQELERLRHHRQGRWIPHLLEFAKYPGERLLGLGVSLGSDLVNFARQGVEVLVASPRAEHLQLVRRNFELRHLPGIFLHASPHALPIETGYVDVVCVTGLLHESAQPTPVVDEIYRVLKPGGKLLAIVPARDGLQRWERFTGFLRRPRPRGSATGHPPGLLSPDNLTFDRRTLRQLLQRFHEGRIYRRHLRRADVHHLCRWMPLGMLERFTGGLFVFKGLKPLSAARADVMAA